MKLTNKHIDSPTFIGVFTEKGLADKDRKEMQKIYAVDRIFAK